MEWDDLFADPKNCLRDPTEEVVGFADRLNDRSYSVLDIGSGAGRHAVYMAQRGHRVFGIDVSTRGTRIAWSWAQSSGLPTRFALADMGRLPFSAGCFDAAVCRGTITHARLAGVRQALAESARVLRTGGWFLCTFVSVDSSLFGRGERIDDHTWVCDDEMEKGVVHHFMTRETVLNETAPFFESHSLYHRRHAGEIETGRPYVSAHWVLEGQRRG